MNNESENTTGVFSEQNSSATEREIVTFQDQGGVANAGFAFPKEMPRELGLSATEVHQHSIVSWLERPMLMYTGSWAQAQTPGASIRSFHLPDAWMQLAPIREKLNGLTFVEGEFVIRVTVNPQPFQQGWLMMWHFPYYKNYQGNALQLKSLTCMSGFPNVKMDISTQKAMELRIPLVLPQSQINLINPQFSLGRINIIVYGQLAGGSTALGYSVWGHLENAKVHIPTGVNINAFGEDAQLFDCKVPATTGAFGGADGPVCARETVAQVDMKQERVVASTGPISSAARAVGDIAMAAAGVPILEPFAAPVAAAASFVGGVAAAFGYSKPTTEAAITPVQVTSAKYFANFNGVDMSKKLAADATNSVGQKQLYGTEVDEMTIQHIIRTPNYYDFFEIMESQTAGTVIYSTRISPIGELKPLAGYTNFYVFTHLAYVARTFQKWRGPIKYDFKFVKTEKFQSGRIRVAVVWQSTIGAATQIYDPNMCYSQIIDLQDKSEFTFEVPYVMNAAWVRNSPNQGGNPSLNPPCTGTLQVMILDPLRVTNTLASTSVGVIVEKYAGDGMEFACPEYCFGAPVTVDTGVPPPPTYNNKVATNKITMSARQYRETTAQMWEPTQQDQAKSGRDDADPWFRVPRTSESISLETVGERIVSLRQLFKRFNLNTRVSVTVAPNTNYMRFHPWALNNITSTTTDNPTVVDSISYFLPLFGYMRGGMRVKIMHNNTTLQSERAMLTGSAFQFPDITGPYQGSIVSSQDTIIRIEPGTAMVVNNPQRDGIFEIEIPFYNDFPICPVPSKPLKFTTTDTKQQQFFTNTRFTWFCDKILEDETIDIYRAIAEDFSCGLLQGTLPIRLAVAPTP